MKPNLRDKIQLLKYASDGCTGAPDFNFRHCCVQHDEHYWQHDISRAEADKKLRKCIQKAWKLPILPWLYWGVVRLVGWRRWK